METTPAPSRIRVDTLIDENDGNLSAGDVSLREALAAVKVGGTITFSRSLQRANAGFGAGVLGLSLGALNIQKSLQIKGLGRDQLTISGNGNSSVFIIDDGDDNNISDVVIDGLSITEGTAAKGGIFSEEKLAVLNSRVTGNSVGITARTTYSSDSSARGDALVVTNSIVSGNAKTGISLQYQPAANGSNANARAQGRGNITVTNSTIEDNGKGGISRVGGRSLSSASGGRGNSANAAKISIIRSTISGNGGIGVSSYDGSQGNSLDIRNSNITNNASTGIAVGSRTGENEATLTNSVVSGNQGAGVEVAGIVTYTRNGKSDPKGFLSVNNSIISRNQRSGLIASDVSVTGSTVADNGSNGVIANDVRVLESTISGSGFRGIAATYNVVVNSSTLAQNEGGAIALKAQSNNFTGTSLTVDSSTISDNGKSAAIAGGIFSTPNVNARGQVDSTVKITNTTLSGNTGSRAGGVLLEAANRPSNSIDYSISNTIIAGNIGRTSDLSGALNRSGFNLIGDRTGATGLSQTDIVGTTAQPIAARLGPLKNNGGPTFTQALLPGSPAIDAGNPNSNSSGFDQRGNGFRRVVDGDGDGSPRIDIGALEAATSNSPPNSPALNIINGDRRNNRLSGTGKRDRISGLNGNDTLIGKSGSDSLLGGTGNDRLFGDGGNDILLGGRGKDKLTGGSGRDTFVYESLREGQDLILDFKKGQDRIDLSAIFNDEKYNSATPFEDYIRLGQVGRNTRLEVLNINPSGNGRGSFKELAIIRRVNPTSLDERSFVL